MDQLQRHKQPWDQVQSLELPMVADTLQALISQLNHSPDRKCGAASSSLGLLDRQLDNWRSGQYVEISWISQTLEGLANLSKTTSTSSTQRTCLPGALKIEGS